MRRPWFLLALALPTALAKKTRARGGGASSPNARSSASSHLPADYIQQVLHDTMMGEIAAMHEW
jgi:hypothetical protein